MGQDSGSLSSQQREKQHTHLGLAQNQTRTKKWNQCRSCLQLADLGLAQTSPKLRSEHAVLSCGSLQTTLRKKVWRQDWQSKLPSKIWVFLPCFFFFFFSAGVIKAAKFCQGAGSGDVIVKYHLKSASSQGPVSKRVGRKQCLVKVFKRRILALQNNTRNMHRGPLKMLPSPLSGLSNWFGQSAGGG